MKLPQESINQIRAQGLYITEACDGCCKVLNQSFRYTVKDKPEVYCSEACRDRVFFGEAGDTKRQGNLAAMPGTKKQCVMCRAEIPFTRRADSTTCSSGCARRLRYQNAKRRDRAA
jgi:hypothetical protein